MLPSNSAPAIHGRQQRGGTLRQMGSSGGQIRSGSKPASLAPRRTMACSGEVRPTADAAATAQATKEAVTKIFSVAVCGWSCRFSP